MIEFTHDLVLSAMTPKPWDFSNRILYDLCTHHPAHTNTSEVLAKVLLIGRAYSAAIERRKNKTDEDQNDDFYINVVAPAIQSSQIDSWLKSARAAIPGTQSGFNTLVETHYEVTTLFSNISGLEKRSLASKYLHFHVPKLFYIFDSRAVEAMRKFSPMLPRASRTTGLADNEYRKFAEKCFHLVQMSEHTFGLSPLPRQIDNLLLAAHASRL